MAAEKELPYVVCLPHLVLTAPEAAKATDFYKNAFGAEVSISFRSKRKAYQEEPLLLYAHLKFGSAQFILSEDQPSGDAKCQEAAKDGGVILHVIIDDVDAAYAKAVDAGAEALEEVAEKPWGVRIGKIKDPYGFIWSFATPVKEEPEEAKDQATEKAAEKAELEAEENLEPAAEEE